MTTRLIAPTAVVARVSGGQHTPADKDVDLRLQLLADSAKMPRSGLFEVVVQEHQTASEVAEQVKEWIKVNSAVERTDLSPDSLDDREWRVNRPSAKGEAPQVSHGDKLNRAKGGASAKLTELEAINAELNGVTVRVTKLVQDELAVLNAAKDFLVFPVVFVAAPTAIEFETADQLAQAYATTIEAVGRALAARHKAQAQILKASSVKQVDDALSAFNKKK